MHCDPMAVVEARGAHVRDDDGPHVHRLHRRLGTGAPRPRAIPAVEQAVVAAARPRPGLRPGLAGRSRPGRAHRGARARLRDGPLRRHRHRGDDERGAASPAPPPAAASSSSSPAATTATPTCSWSAPDRAPPPSARPTRRASRPARWRTPRSPRFNDLASVDRCFAEADGRRRGRDRRAGGRQHGLRAAGRRLPRRPARRAAPGTAPCSSSTR